MSNPLISIQVQDTMSPALRAQAVGINPPRALVARLGGELKKALQEHFRARGDEGNKHKWPSREFWNREVAVKMGAPAVGEHDATITIASRPLLQKVYGGRITPKAGKKALAIPMCELAYRRGQPSDWDRQDLMYIPGKRPFLALREGDAKRRRGQAKTGKGALRIMYRLVPFVDQAPDPRALPDRAGLVARLSATADKWFARWRRTAGSAGVPPA